MLKDKQERNVIPLVYIPTEEQDFKKYFIQPDQGGIIISILTFTTQCIQKDKPRHPFYHINTMLITSAGNIKVIYYLI